MATSLLTLVIDCRFVCASGGCDCSVDGGVVAGAWWGDVSGGDVDVDGDGGAVFGGVSDGVVPTELGGSNIVVHDDGVPVQPADAVADG